MMHIEEVLKPGITGFSKYPDMFEEQDNKKFEMYLYQALNLNKGKVKYKEHLVNNKNFFTYYIELNHQQFYILLNSIYPLIAYASSVDFSGISFIDSVGILDINFQPLYKILSKDILDKTIEKNDLGNLRDYEMKNIKYWNPRTIGEVIFNYWD